MTARPPRTDLRRLAEERVRKSRTRERAPSEVEAERLLQELRVHEVELEMQNDELRASRLDVENLLRRYAELFDYAPVGFFRITADGRILESNFAGARVLGHERGALAGRPLAALAVQRDRPAFEAFLAEVLSDPEDLPVSRTCELVFLGKKDEELHAHVTAVALERGAAPTALVALEDVTARRRAEQALREEGRQKDEFLAALSHELRNPLAPIRNALALLHLLPAGEEKAGAALAVIDRQVQHLARIVDDLLDVTRVARGKVRLQRQPLELGELVRRTLDDHRPGFEARKIHLAARLPAEPIWVDADASRLVQVLGNLLANALKFTDEGGRVDVGLAAERDVAVLRVRDDGVGIDDVLIGHIFEPFSQAPQTLDRSRGGLGLGLATVKGLVELHGGSIQVESRGPGRGSEFTVRLPVIAAPRRRGPGPAAPRPAPRRVLIVEDNADAAQSLKDLLELAGHEVRVAGDGAAGLFLAREFHPQVILCDLGLPGMSGYDFAEALRADGAGDRPWLVALSGYGQPEDVRRAGAAGFDRHVVKPASLELIEQVFAEAQAKAHPG